MTTSTSASGNAITTYLLGVALFALCALIASSWVYLPMKQLTVSWGLSPKFVMGLVFALLVASTVLITRRR